MTLLLPLLFQVKRIRKKKKPAKILNAIRPIEMPPLEDPKNSREAAWSWWTEFECEIKISNQGPEQ